jgi:hypothetical protein
MTVLFPWHHQLDDDFKKLEKKQLQELEKFHEVKYNKLEKIESDISKILHLLEQNEKIKTSTNGDKSEDSEE